MIHFKKDFFLLVGFLLALNQAVLFSQDSRIIDSLKNEYTNALDLPSRSEYLLEIATEYINLNTDSSFVYSSLIKEIALDHNDSNLLAKGLRIEGTVYMQLGKFEESTELLLKSLEIDEKEKNPLQAQFTKKSLGNVYIKQGDMFWDLYEDSLAMEYYQKSNDIYEEVLANALLLKDSTLISDIYFNLGSTANRLYNFEESLDFYDLSLIWCKREFYNQEYYIVQSSKMASLFELKRTEEAAILLSECQQYFRENDKFEDWLICNINMSNNYIEVDPPACLSLLLEADSLADVINNVNLKIESSRRIYEYYKRNGIYEKSLQYLEKQSDLSSDVMSSEATAAIEELNLKYDTEKSEKELLAEKREKEKAKARNIILSIILVSVIVLLVFGTLYFTQKQKTQRLKQEQEVDELLQNQEIATLQSNLEGQDKERKRIAKDLHDRLGSRLSAVGMYMEASYDNEAPSELQDKALKELHNAIKETREIAYNLETGILSKFGLVSALEDLKQKLNETQSLELKLDYPEDMPRFGSDKETEVYRVVQEIINNTLKHAQAHILDLKLEINDGLVTLIIKDNGVGFNSEVRKMGMGLKNINSRIHKLDGSVELKSIKNVGTSFNIQFKV